MKICPRVFFEGADFKNSGNHYVTPMVPAKNVQFKMAPINHVIVHKSAVYEPITAMLVSISMFLRSVNATKHIYIKGRLPAKKIKITAETTCLSEIILSGIVQK